MKILPDTPLNENEDHPLKPFNKNRPLPKTKESRDFLAQI